MRIDILVSTQDGWKIMKTHTETSPELTRRQVLGVLATLGITGPAAAVEAGNVTRLREALTKWKGVDVGVSSGDTPYSSGSVEYLKQMDARFSKLTPRQIAARVKELSFADANWRRQKCISLRAAEGIMGAGTQSLLNSSLATRVTEGVPADKDLPGIRGTDEYIDEIEAAFIYQLRKIFKAQYVEWRPLSNSMANAMVYLGLTKPGDVIMAQAAVGGGANAANTPRGPGQFRDLAFVEMPFLDNYEYDVEGIRTLAREVKPNFIVAGGGYVLFPYPLRELRAIADEVGAKIMYDAAHVAILIAGGMFQQPLADGADVMTMSTHKAFGGPVGGIVLTNDSVIAAGVINRTLDGFIQTRDVNKYVAGAYALAEVAEFGAPCARQMVQNAKAFAAALEERGFKPLARDKGYTQTHQIIVDIEDIEDRPKFRNACMTSNILIQGARLAREAQHEKLGSALGLRLSVAETTRLGMKESHMEEIARFMSRAREGEASTKLAAEVEEFVKPFQTVQYTFSI